jgi:glycosyltransferase involved in cell wall biosynthesis
MFDPGDTDTIAATLRQVLSSSELRRELASLGTAQARRFSWRRVAAETQSVYDDTIEHLAARE